jgi:hypothetical protein
MWEPLARQGAFFSGPTSCLRYIKGHLLSAWIGRHYHARRRRLEPPSSKKRAPPPISRGFCLVNISLAQVDQSRIEPCLRLSSRGQNN